MRVAAKDPLVSEPAAPYCSKLTSQKLLNATMKTKLHERVKLTQKYVIFFPSNDEYYSLLTKCTIRRKKIPKTYKLILTTKITTFAF